MIAQYLSSCSLRVLVAIASYERLFVRGPDRVDLCEFLDMDVLMLWKELQALLRLYLIRDSEWFSYGMYTLTDAGRAHLEVSLNHCNSRGLASESSREGLWIRQRRRWR